MRKSILLLTLCFSIIPLFAQSDKKNMIGTHVAFGTGGYGSARLKGAPSSKTNYFYTIGLDYSRQLSKRWDFCSGFEYTYTDLKKSFGYYTDGKQAFNSANLKMTTIPLQLKYHVGRFIYLNGGPLLNITAKERATSYYLTFEDATSDVAMLLGFGLGLGFEHEFKSGLTLSLSPYARFNGIGKALSFQSKPLEHYKYLQGGVNLGIGFKF